MLACFSGGTVGYDYFPRSREGDLALFSPSDQVVAVLGTDKEDLKGRPWMEEEG